MFIAFFVILMIQELSVDCGCAMVAC